ncbi:MAG: hydroxymethylglutaryl-CoA lyase, partial [Cetobacterium sp.]
MGNKNNIEIIEIGPRDGFQNVTEFIPTEKKKEIIERLIEAGVKRMQLTSFVSPKHIPQMQDAEEIVKYFINKYKDIRFFALVPNYRGAKRAFDI